MTTSNTEVDEWTAEELREISKMVDLKGRSNMRKKEMYDELKDNHPEMLEPFSIVVDGKIEEGDKVVMNHLKSELEVIEVGEKDKYHWVVMVTNRGGRHGLVVPKEGEEVGKNDSDPHLKRWRAGDKEWMNNSDDPVYIKEVVEESEEGEENE